MFLEYNKLQITKSSGMYLTNTVENTKEAELPSSEITKKEEMTISSEMRDPGEIRRGSFVFAASPDEQRDLDSKNSIREAVKEGLKAASISAAVAAVPTLVGCRVIPWAKANLNHTAQALIISAAGIAGFFITADKTILERARGNTMGKYDK